MPIALAQDAVDRFVELGRTESLADGLRAILADGLPAPCSATGLALVPDDGTDLTPEPHVLAAATGLRLVRLAPSSQQSQDTDTRTAVLLAALRLGMTIRLLDLAVAHLASRRVDGAPLTDKQMLQAAVAEAAAAVELCRRGLRTATTHAAAEALHACLADSGWSIVTLFGAGGYLRDHAALDFYAAELVYDAWVAPIGALT